MFAGGMVQETPKHTAIVRDSGLLPHLVAESTRCCESLRVLIFSAENAMPAHFVLVSVGIQDG